MKILFKSTTKNQNPAKFVFKDKEPDSFKEKVDKLVIFLKKISSVEEVEKLVKKATTNVIIDMESEQQDMNRKKYYDSFEKIATPAINVFFEGSESIKNKFNEFLGINKKREFVPNNVMAILRKVLVVDFFKDRENLYQETPNHKGWKKYKNNDFRIRKSYEELFKNMGISAKIFFKDYLSDTVGYNEIGIYSLEILKKLLTDKETKKETFLVIKGFLEEKYR